jgi:hypothetical protein
MKTAIVSLAGVIASVYEGEPNQANYGGPWGRPEEFKHIEVPEGVNTDQSKVEFDEAGVASFVDDTDKLQLFRNNKLSQLRSLRAVKLAEVDLLVNDVALGEAGAPTSSDLKTYRAALKDFTTPYRYANDHDRAKAAIDGLDLSNITWPTL